MRVGSRLVALSLLVPAAAFAERPEGVCVEVSVDFTPSDALQIVAWLEDSAGNFVDTIFITQKTGRFGLGNRPGRADFNTGSLTGDTFPYGRRDQTFPVWAHRHGKTFPLVVFQNGDENNLSHPFSESSPESPPPYCRPIKPQEETFDSGTCASATFTDKGTFASSDQVSLYPPRSDLTRRGEDAPAVEMFRSLNPFDAVSRATPAGGVPATMTWSAPQHVDFGSYVLHVETSKTYDFNMTYNTMTYPAPTGIPWADYGKPWRGQPSVVYRVPIAITMSESSASTTDYVGYGDPSGATGTLHPPDATITTDTPGSGASRMQLVSDGGTMYRVRVRTKTDFDSTAPASVGVMSVADLGSTNAKLAFSASGDDGMVGKVTGYEVRYRVGTPITAENFAESTALTTTVVPVEPGNEQLVELIGLLPDTDYYIGIRAYDNCFNHGALVTTQFTTLERDVPAVDWCFIATAAYGSKMASDVALLRGFRDSMLRESVLGELLVETYYTFSPAAAAVIRDSELLRASARAILGPIIDWVRQLTY
jgi:hypothetical protein